MKSDVTSLFCLKDGRLEAEEEYEEELELEYGEEELEEEEELLETILLHQAGGDKEASPPHHSQVPVLVIIKRHKCASTLVCNGVEEHQTFIRFRLPVKIFMWLRLWPYYTEKQPAKIKG
jgi:hypothetical protein